MADLRVAPPTVNRHELKVGERAGGLHVRVSTDDPDVIQVSFFAPPGILVAGADLKAIEQTFSRQEFRRVSPGEIGGLTYPARATESYVQELLGTLDRDAIRSRELPARAELRHVGGVARDPVADRRAGRRDGGAERVHRLVADAAAPRHGPRARRHRRPGAGPWAPTWAC